MPDNPFTNELIACPACGAASAPQAKFCWMCGGPLEVVAAKVIVSKPVEAKPPPARPDDWFTHGAVWAGIFLAALVGYGIFGQDQSVGVIYLVAVGPALLVTLLASISARAGGRPLHPTMKILTAVLTAVGSVAIGALVLVFIVVSAILSLISFCFGGGSH